MAELPEASVSISDEAGAFGGGTGYAIVVGCVERNADVTPRVYASITSLLSQHGYSQAVDYAAHHMAETRKPVIFVGVPTATAGSIGSNDPTGVEGTSVITVAAGSNGVLEEVDAIVTVTTGGTIGANGIVLSISLDGGRTSKTVRLGTATSYTIPYVGIVLNFAAGTLVAGDVYTFRSIAPMWDGTGITNAKAALAAQLKLARTVFVAEELPNSTFAGYITTAVNGYETEDQRFTLARVGVRDRRLGKKSKIAAQTFTFATTGDTVTRSAGSWIDDGYRVGDTVRIDGTASNDGDIPITVLSATVLTTSTNLTDETIDGDDFDADQVLTMAAWVSETDAAFASVDSQKRIDLALARRRKVSRITGWNFRRPFHWAVSIREYQHDLHIPAWRKSDGPLDGWDGEDEAGNIVEFDERVDGGALAGRFTCPRSYSNGPRGTFCALSMTRASEGSLLSRSHNMQVANHACTVVQAETENAIGSVLVLNSDGTGDDAYLARLEGRVNSALQMELLQDKGEGPRASEAVWSASRADVLNVPGAEITGTLRLLLNGTLEKITTRVRIQTAG